MQEKTKVLIVDDENAIRRFLRTSLDALFMKPEPGNLTGAAVCQTDRYGCAGGLHGNDT